MLRPACDPATVILCKNTKRESPGDGPVVRTWRFHCSGRGFDPWSRIETPVRHTVQLQNFFFLKDILIVKQHDAWD